MGFAELIEQLNDLPPEKQSEVIDFANFIAKKYQKQRVSSTLADSSLGVLIMNGIAPAFHPMSREDANAR
jgi:hypothetical protein